MKKNKSYKNFYFFMKASLFLILQASFQAQFASFDILYKRIMKLRLSGEIIQGTSIFK